MKIVAVFLALLMLCFPVSAFEGYDSSTGEEVDIQGSRDGLGSEGELDYFDEEDGSYHRGVVNEPYEGEGPVDVYESDSGRTSELERD
ncbi:MAG: hypothetical protein GF408_07650 [Candidatus Omnitrophica bacterium]|nr:hypothetical protein [Candidatus Omnitrophota bacterium]